MRVIINPKYEHLREYIEHIDEHFEHEGHEIHRDRNVIRTLQVGDLTLCVKRFGKTSLPLRVATKLHVRTPKGRKAFIRPLLLKERGFHSPEPVAFVRYSRGLIGAESYFICLMSLFSRSMADIMDLDEAERREVTIAFAQYAAHLHNTGFLHRDFSADNILFGRVEDGLGERYRFSLIDTNSMRCGRSVGIKKGCANFARLVGDDDFFVLLAETYAQARLADIDECRALVIEARDSYRERTGRQ